MRSKSSLRGGPDLLPTPVGRDGEVAARGRLGPAPGSAVLVLLLVSEVESLLTGAEILFYASIMAAWLVLPFVVGLKNVLDAGCFFMLVSLGIVVVVDLAGHGQTLLQM
jgi:hypothetical protein